MDLLQGKRELICTYVNKQGHYSVKVLSECHYANNKNGERMYIQAYESDIWPKTLIISNILDCFDSVEEAEKSIMDKLIEQDKCSDNDSDINSAATNSFYVEPSSDKTFDICFTGFPAAEKQELKNIAIEHGMIPRKDVVINLDVLCCGFRAGPAKIKKAMEKGTHILSRSQFEELLLTGEIPENA